MNVCIIAPESLPVPPKGYWGGTESICYDLCTELIERNIRVSLIARPESKLEKGFLLETFQDVPDKLGVNERHFNCYKDYVSKFDGIVHDHSNGKLAHTVHNSVINTYHWQQHPYASNYKNIVAISNAHAKWIRQFMPENTAVDVIHHGINPDRFIYKEKKENFYLYFSVIAGYKGALDALRIAKDTGENIMFAGRDGDASDVIKNMNMQNVIYYGEASNRERAILMSKAKALIFPTGSYCKTDWLECFGIVQLEALASGTPVISSGNGACPEIIKDGQTGFVCYTYEEMKNIVKENLVEYIKPTKCREHVINNFSAKIMTDKYIKLYESISNH